MTTQQQSAVTAAEVLETIKAKAIQEWGEDRWIADLTRKCNEIYHEEGDSITAFRNRRSQIGRMFAKGSCTADWLFKLAFVVGCKVTIE